MCIKEERLEYAYIMFYRIVTTVFFCMCLGVCHLYMNFDPPPVHAHIPRILNNASNYTDDSSLWAIATLVTMSASKTRETNLITYTHQYVF